MSEENTEEKVITEEEASHKPNAGNASSAR